ncbi:MAG: hypothetical protein IJT34_09410, partial [Butyrivibrio sp.]|nr:hypothetical protein [Butyrivibrio sp.]
EQDAASSLLGCLPKAVLMIWKDRTTKAEDVNDGMKALQRTLLNETKMSKQSDMEAAMTGVPGLDKIKDLGGDNFMTIQVQYNPSSIYLDTSAGMREIDSSSISNIMANQVTQINTEAITTLAMQLVLDDMNIQDAFMLDSLNISTGTAASLLMDVARPHSVRMQVEALIACLMTPATQQAIFYWSDMVFRGVMFQVNANYTMFNKKGEPVRAVLDIQMQQDHQMESAEKGGYWDKAFNRVFGEPGNLSLKGKENISPNALGPAGRNALLNLAL